MLLNQSLDLGLFRALSLQASTLQFCCSLLYQKTSNTLLRMHLDSFSDRFEGFSSLLAQHRYTVQVKYKISSLLFAYPCHLGHALTYKNYRKYPYLLTLIGAKLSSCK